MPKLVALLGATSFGLFSLAWVVIGYLTFLDVGVNRAATKFVSEYLADRDLNSVRELIRTAFVANLTLGLIGGLFVALSTPYLVHTIFKVPADLQSQARLVFLAVALAVPALLVQGIFRAVLSSFQRFGWINAVNAFTTTVQWGLAGILAWEGKPIALVVFSTVVVRILATGAYGIVLSRLLPGLQLSQPHRLHGLSRLLKFGTWVSVSQLVSPLLVYLDRVLIAAFVSFADVTLYTVPYEVMTRLRIIPASLVNTLYPAFSERKQDTSGAPLVRLYVDSIRYLLLVLLPIVLFLVVLGADPLRLWMGSSFAEQASLVLKILAVGLLPNALAYVPYNLLQASGRPDITGKFHVLELPIYVVLCVVLIPRWGIAGAAMANTARLVVDSILLFWAAGKYCQCPFRSLWVNGVLRILILGLTFGMVLVAINLAFDNPWKRLGAGVVALGLCFLASWVFIVDKAHKPIIGAVLNPLSGELGS
jgi:O-antigen/teichoic acid export membrane protein